MPVELLEAAEVNRVDRDVNGGATSGGRCRGRDFILVLEVTAGATSLAGVVLPDVIAHCHLVRQKAPPPQNTRTHTHRVSPPSPPTKGTYLINFWQELNRFKMILQ